MLLLASSVCGLFKWRQFEPEVILLAVNGSVRGHDPEKFVQMQKPVTRFGRKCYNYEIEGGRPLRFCMFREGGP